MYKVIQSFPGSPDGINVRRFEEGEEISHAELGDDLAEVALKEKWIRKQTERTRRSAPKAAAADANPTKNNDDKPAEDTGELLA